MIAGLDSSAPHVWIPSSCSEIRSLNPARPLRALNGAPGYPCDTEPGAQAGAVPDKLRSVELDPQSRTPFSLALNLRGDTL